MGTKVCMILQSLLRTFFIQLSLDTLFERSINARKIQDLVNGKQISREDCYVGMRLSRIHSEFSSSDPGDCMIDYYNCQITYMLKTMVGFQYEWATFPDQPGRIYPSGASSTSFTVFNEYYL